jgi:hypothetical protein
MDIILIKEDGKVIGWDIVRDDSDEDKDIINTMRNKIFFGFDDTEIKYDGRTGEDNQVDSLRFRQKMHKTKY